MGSLGFQEILVILLVILFVFGPERLPEFAREAGKVIARFRKESARSINELKRAADIEDLDREIKSLSRDLRDVRSSVARAITAEPTTDGVAPTDDGVAPTEDEIAVPERAEHQAAPTDPDAT
ncbi:MAG: Sec-independent protein translocase protein TatB [Nitriliruptorales bacterium]|nr:Sec-independent protein translocase protein TatB [Nitriliruptorales bacterium]